MNGKNLDVRYRRNAYSKKRIKVILAMGGGALALLLILFLIIGVVLKDKVDDDKQKRQEQTTQTPTPTPTHKQANEVNGYGISLSGLTASGLSDKTLEIYGAGGSNINFVARDTSGRELYKSALAQNMGKQTSSGQYIDVTDIGSRASNRGLTASAIVPIYSFSKNDGLERASQLFYDASICAELFKEGADDVLVRLEETQISTQNIDELLRLAGWVKDLDSEVVLGITITKDLLESTQAEVLIGKLWEHYDFLALDLTDIKTAEDLSKEGENSEMQFYLLMYKMRVLLPNASVDELKNMVSSLNSMNVDNWQTVVS